MSAATKSSTPNRVLPADVYDAIELVALIEGGIGAERFWTSDGHPYCAVGIASDLDGEVEGYPNAPVGDALFMADLYVGENDRAVHAINKRLGRLLSERVPFADWCAELGVERGS